MANQQTAKDRIKGATANGNGTVRPATHILLEKSRNGRPDEIWYVEYVNACGASVRCVTGSAPGSKMMISSSLAGYRYAFDEELPLRDHGAEILQAKEAKVAAERAAKRADDAQLAAAIATRRAQQEKDAQAASDARIAAKAVVKVEAMKVEKAAIEALALVDEKAAKLARWRAGCAAAKAKRAAAKA